ncbi:MAG: divergent polysaccharide deacetylase family protein [Elusimicrobiota bacterium]
MTDSKGIIKILYAVILFLIGVLLWVLWHGTRQNYTDLSWKFDATLTDTMVAGGIKNSDIVSRVQDEKKSARASWTFYSKEILLSPSVDLKKLISACESAAKKRRMVVRVSGGAPGKTTVDFTYRNILLSRVIFMPASASSASAHKRFAMVIDDIGYTRDLSAFTDLGIPITFAVMPYELYSRRIAQDLTQKKMPYILHLPMEPEAYPKIDPGKAAVMTAMNAEEIKHKFLSDLATVPGVVGVSNHMGSRFSANAEKMRILLSLVKAQKLFYFDSYTTPHSVAGSVARELHLASATNQLFVDEKDDAVYMQRQFDDILKKFQKLDRFIAIGHIQKKNLPAVLKHYIPLFKAQGIEFVYLPALIEQQ